MMQSSSDEKKVGRKHCIVCKEDNLAEFLDLGSTALANKFLSPEELLSSEPVYPLKVGFCQTCGHVQLMEAVPPPAMFEDYLYLSSASDTLRAHLDDLSQLLVRKYQLGAAQLVTDIGCNDCTLLKGFQRLGVRTLGVDPANNLAELTSGSGIDRYVGYFGEAAARDILHKWGQASVITATNTFPHIQDLEDFVRGLRILLAPGGVFVLEAHYLLDLLQQTAFDTIYHEHISYWALRPMKRLFVRNGMQITNVEHLPIHHGQMRAYVQRQGEGEVLPGVDAMLEKEQAMGMDKLDTYIRFAEKVRLLRRELRDLLVDLRKQGIRIAAYGAPAKGNTLLSFFGIGPETMEYIADKSPLKQGRFAPGSHIPVVPPSRLLSDQPDYTVLLAWNFTDEILQQQDEYRRRGGKFIIPVPQVNIV